MYCLSEQQIDFILSDIRARGVEMEDLQSNLLDHICCIIEENLKEGEDFESFYRQTIPKFYKKELWELEEETITLLIFKNYPVMKKAMIRSGIISASLLSLGIIGKFLRLPGSSPCLVLGIVIMSFVFLPLLFTLKAREQKSKKDKLILGLGVFAASLMCLSVLFKIMLWPYALYMGIGSVVILLVFFLPIYFVNGMRNPDTKVNSIVTSILLIGGCGLFLSLVSVKRMQGTLVNELSLYTTGEQILKAEQTQVAILTSRSSKPMQAIAEGAHIGKLCEELKSGMYEYASGQAGPVPSSGDLPNLHQDFNPGDFLVGTPKTVEKMEELGEAVQAYNKAGKDNLISGFTPVSEDSGILAHAFARTSAKARHDYFSSVLVAMNNLTQIEMTILQNEERRLMGN
ncbi:MAG: hypothetical protein ACHQRM_14080 [Bacteroidia bacterium]